jgi:hypothetical protein
MFAEVCGSRSLDLYAGPNVWKGRELPSARARSRGEAAGHYARIFCNIVNRRYNDIIERFITCATGGRPSESFTSLTFKHFEARSAFVVAAQRAV